MNCPECAQKSAVIDTGKKVNYVRRRRKCKACGHRWTTREITVEEFDRLCGGPKTQREEMLRQMKQLSVIIEPFARMLER
jgi:transcriptional regulator NrdR family protein